MEYFCILDWSATWKCKNSFVCEKRDGAHRERNAGNAISAAALVP